MNEKENIRLRSISINATKLKALFEIPESIPTGLFDVSVEQVAEFGDVTKPYAFQITKAPARIVAVDPDTAARNEHLTVEITGYNTFFLWGCAGPDCPWLSKGSKKIWAKDCDEISKTFMKAYFEIPPTASLGLWDLSVFQSNHETVTLKEGFTIVDSFLVNPQK
jgi:hypothetical protein